MSQRRATRYHDTNVLSYLTYSTDRLSLFRWFQHAFRILLINPMSEETEVTIQVPNRDRNYLQISSISSKMASCNIEKYHDFEVVFGTRSKREIHSHWIRLEPNLSKCHINSTEEAPPNPTVSQYCISGWCCQTCDVLWCSPDSDKDTLILLIHATKNTSFGIEKLLHLYKW